MKVLACAFGSRGLLFWTDHSGCANRSIFHLRRQSCPSHFCNMHGGAMRRALRLRKPLRSLSTVFSFRVLPAPHLGMTLISRVEIVFVGLQNDASGIVRPNLKCHQQEPHLSRCDNTRRPSSFTAKDIPGSTSKLLQTLPV